MTRDNEIFNYIRDMIAEMRDLTEEEVSMETSIDELGLDSLDYVEIKVNVTREFMVHLTPMLFETKIKTVGQLCTYIAQESASKEA
ncbi:acyl carrier protein [Burkholderia stabilis]|uniref:acyl carrier protein n=1 Tax=Burkholderia stabilis TaxID=95485 RepID=UPI00158CBEA3|nr:phosphopantetheine-binding protein [Burkholderia stabilis]